MTMKLDMKKIDKLAEDLAKLEIPKVVKTNKDGAGAIPMFQTKGYLEKLGTKRDSKWYKRFFVLRDSFLLSYNLDKSDFTVEPNKCIHLAKCKVETLSMKDHPYCFAVTTQENDRFLFSAPTEKELLQWKKDIEVAKIITHKNMVKLAVENQCIAEAKGIAHVTKDHSSSALSIFSNPEYIKNTPVTGGAEGWLRTPGFCTAGGKLKKNFFMLRDSHILMFHSGDELKKPRGAMYLIGTIVKEMEDPDPKNFRFAITSNHCADFIELVATAATQRARWMSAIVVGSRVTYGDFKLLLKEHEILTSFNPASDEPVTDEGIDYEEPIAATPDFTEDHTIEGSELEPGTQQPYDAEGNPMIRNPEGKLVDASGAEVAPQTARFTAAGQQLDPFNRPLPKKAVPMFTADGQPIGVGPDGGHYLPDGTVIEKNAPHFDAKGCQLTQDVVDAADEVANKIGVAIKVRARMKADGAEPEAVDVLGRTFRPSKDKQGDTLINADGVAVPVATARRLVNKEGEVTAKVEEEPPKVPQTGRLVIQSEYDGDMQELGAVEVDENTTLADVRKQIKHDVSADFSDFVFVINYVAITKEEEQSKSAMSCLPEVQIRGVELKATTSIRKFNKKVNEMINYEEEKRKEAENFNEIMNKIRAGNFLRKVAKE